MLFFFSILVKKREQDMFVNLCFFIHFLICQSSFIYKKCVEIHFGAVFIKKNGRGLTDTAIYHSS